MREKVNWTDREAHAFLRRGRMPYARARLVGTESSSIQGEIAFYDTPAGVMISAELEGLPRDGTVYGFCLCGEGGESCREGRGLCLGMPLLHGKDGWGRCVAVTEKLRLVSLGGRRVSLRRSTEPLLCHGAEVARGVIE